MALSALHRLKRAFHDAHAERDAKRQAARLQRAVADLPDDLNADNVGDFLFSKQAELIQPWQYTEELRALARLVARRRPRTVLEIGTADGGTLFAHARLAAPDALVLSIDLPEGPFGGGYPAWRAPLYESFARPGQRLELLRADSHAEATAERLAELLGERQVDYAFIDGDHTYDGVRQDFELCRRFSAADAVVAFHDIAVHPPETGCEVYDFWREVREQYRYEEFVRDADQDCYGIGVLYLGETTQNAP